MDEVLDAAELIVDAGLEEAFAWILRIVGVLLLLVGLGLWLGTDMGLLVIPAALIVLGLLLVVIPSLLLGVFELVA
jgi:hypothetical protein